jgi:hypothetical protein
MLERNEMSDFPDVYADGFGLTAGQYGVTLTFTHILPTGEPGPHEEPTEPVVRLRIGRELAKTLQESLSQFLAASAQLPSSSAPTRH